MGDYNDQSGRGRAGGDDVDLWVATAEAVLSRGASLDVAMVTADRVISAYWRTRRQAVVAQHPGLVKCAAPTMVRNVTA